MINRTVVLPSNLQICHPLRSFVANLWPSSPGESNGGATDPTVKLFRSSTWRGVSHMEPTTWASVAGYQMLPVTLWQTHLAALSSSPVSIGKLHRFLWWIFHGGLFAREYPVANMPPRNGRCQLDLSNHQQVSGPDMAGKLPDSPLRFKDPLVSLKVKRSERKRAGNPGNPPTSQGFSTKMHRGCSVSTKCLSSN